MPHKYTKEERVKKLKEKYNTRKEKLYGILVLVVVFFCLMFALSYLLQIGADPVITVALVVIILLLIPIMVFSIDHLMYEVT